MTWDKHKKPLSWSAISSFKYDTEQWYQSYVLGIKGTSKQMEFGKEAGSKLEKDPTFLPSIPRQSVMEYKFHVTFGDIELVGFADSFGECALREFKTGVSPWTQEKVDKHHQITMYLLMNYIQNKQLPEAVTCTLHWMPTEEKGDGTIGFKEPIEEKIQHFTTKRTTKDILEFAGSIPAIIKEMESYAQAHD